MTGNEEIDTSEASGERLSANADALKEAWQHTLEEMDALAEEYEAEGWDTTTVPAGHTAPESETAGDTDRWGFVFTVPGNYADDVQAVVAEGEFPAYDVYRNQAAEQVFLVVVYLDPPSESALLVAGSYQLAYSRTLNQRADAEGEVYSYLQTLDGTQLAAFRHGDPEKFFPSQ